MKHHNEHYKHGHHARRHTIVKIKAQVFNSFFHYKINNVMNFNKIAGAFSGKLTFLNAENQPVDISKGTNPSLVADNAAVGSVTLNTADGTFSGTAVAPGVLTLTANITNDQGAVIPLTFTITFGQDTTIVSIDVTLN